VALCSDVDLHKILQEKFTGNFEQTVADRTRQLNEEMKKSDLLLYRMLPKLIALLNHIFIQFVRFIADKLKSGQAVEPQVYDDCSLLVSDIEQFSSLAARSTGARVCVCFNVVRVQQCNVC
jgi:hypothetical protein